MSDNCNFTNEILLMILGTIVALTVQYWFIRRRELRKRIIDIINELKTLQAISIEYWSKELSEADCLIYEVKIKVKIHNIQNTSKQLQKSYFSYRPNIKHEFIQLKKAITSGEFETRPKPVIIGRVELIEKHSSLLENGIRNSQKII